MMTAPAPGASTEMQPTGKDTTYSVAVERPEVQPPGLASHTLPGASGRSKVQLPDPTGQPFLVLKKQAKSFTSTTAP